MFQRKKVETKSFDDNFYPIHSNNYSIFSKQSLSRGDYLRLYTGWAYSCVNAITDNVAGLEYQLLRTKKNNKSDINHKHLQLITPELLKEISSYLQLNGTCYLQKDYIGNSVDSLTILRPDLMQLIDNITPGAPYQYTDGLGITRQYTEDDIIEFKLFNPLENPPLKSKGVSPLSAVAMQMQMDNMAIDNNNSLLKNGANPKGHLTTEQTLTKEQVVQLSEKWNMQHKGSSNSGQTAILPNGLHYNTSSISPKELDFVESRRFTRDEVYTVFGVPKEILGFLDNANLASAKMAETMFRRNKILPLARLIESVLNKTLFKGIGHFQFINIIPTDEEELRKNLAIGGITLNEFRQKIGYKPLTEGNKLYASEGMQTEVNYEPEKDKKEFTVKKDIKAIESFKKSVKESVKGTDEYMEKQLAERNARLETAEDKLKKELKKVFSKQQTEIINKLKQKKKIKSLEDDLDLASYYALYLTLTQDIFESIILVEGQKALDDLGVDQLFKPGNTDLGKWIKLNTGKWSESVDKTTFKAIEEAIKRVEDQGLGINQMVQEVKKVYNDLETYRIDQIVRTEVIRAGTHSQLTAWEQSEVVDRKEWYTALDERVCPHCNSMHGKVIGLKDNFFKKGDELDVQVNGKTNKLKLNYEDIKGPGLHVSCRCGLIPIVTD